MADGMADAPGWWPRPSDAELRAGADAAAAAAYRLVYAARTPAVLHSTDPAALAYLAARDPDPGQRARFRAALRDWRDGPPPAALVPGRAVRPPARPAAVAWLDRLAAALLLLMLPLLLYPPPAAA